MFVGKVTGSVVSTQKVESMRGQKMLLVEPYCLDKETQSVLSSIGKTFVAVDTVGAGEGEFVLVVQGSSARLTPETRDLPVDAVIVGIVDAVQARDKCVYSKEDNS